MPASQRPSVDANTLRQRFGWLRRRLRAVSVFRGTSYLLVLVLSVAVLTGVLDWRFHLPDLIRGLVLVGILTAGALSAYRHLLRPLSARADDLSLALRIEDRYPILNDSLASTVEFLDREGRPEGESSALEREAVRRALGRVNSFDFGKIIDTRGLRWAGLGAGAALALAATLTFLNPMGALTAVARLADPFGGHEWPRKTRLVLENPRQRIGRNEVFEVRAKVFGVIPQTATVLFRFEGFPPTEHLCEVVTQPDGSGHLATRLDSSRVHSTFYFHVRANDAVSPEYEIQVLPPPNLVSLDDKPSPQVRLFYPAYTRLASPEDLSPGMANIEAVTGTRVVLRARADRPLARAWVEYQPEVPAADLSGFLAALGATDYLSALSLDACGRQVWQSVSGVLDEDRCTFTVEFMPRINGFFDLRFEDESGLSNNKLYELRLKPDPAPTVRLERPSPARDILSVLPEAELTLDATADDPQYAVRSVFLEYRIGPSGPMQRLDLYDPQQSPARQVAMWTGIGALSAPPLDLRPTHLEFKQSLPLRLLRHPDGSPLKEDDVVFLQVCADDYDDVSVNKEPGRSHQVEVHIVGRNALELELNKEQARVQQELMRLREKEREAIGKVREGENRLKKGEKLNPEDIEKLIQAEQSQQQIRERVGDRKEGLRAEVTRILEAVRQNALENSAVRDRMEDVSRELGRLAENELQQIEPRLTNARQTAEAQAEQSQAARKNQLEQRARQAEQEAKSARQTAEQKDAQAERDERAGKVQEARAEKRQAAEQRQRARELDEQAERDRREAAQSQEKDHPRQALAEARKSQEEVEKTLNDLLTRLEPWSSSREIKGEASKLLEDQKKLQNAVEKIMDQKDFIGKSPEELSKDQKEDLENLKEAQQKLEERTRQLLGKMKRVAEQRAEKDPETARELRDALEQAEKDQLGEPMKLARENIEKNKLSDAKADQARSIEKLNRLVKNLEDRREAELDRLIKRMKKAEKELDELIQEQERLQKKVKEAAAKTNAAQREADLKQLARQQQELQKKTKEMMEQLARLRAGRASQALNNADEQMDDAEKQLTRGEQAEQKQEDVLDRLDEALEELEEARKKAEDQLGREQLTRVADVIKRIKERQESLATEAERIQKQVMQHKDWGRSLRTSLKRMGDSEKGLGEETAQVAEKDLSRAPVFARTLQRAAEAMTKAGERAEAMVKQPPPVETLPDAEEAQQQGEAVRRLARLLEAVKNAAEAPQRSARQGGGGGGGDGGGGAANPGDSIPPLAQYKMLREMQADINKRTESFRNQHPKPDKLTDSELSELKALQRDQKDVAELLDELQKEPADEPAGNKGDKK
jgi:hypothetical protein